MTPEEQFDQIEAYLDGKLGKEDKEHFEAALSKNEELQKLVKQHRLEREAMELLVEKDLRDQMEDWEMEADQKDASATETKERKLWPVFAVAASILLLALFYFLLPVQGTSGQQLAEQFYETPALERGLDSNNPLRKGQRFFVQKEYTAAIERFEAINRQDSMYWTAKEWEGHALFKIGELEQAITVFSALSTQAPEPFDHRGDWNLILIYLIQDKKVEAKERLDSIVADENHLYHPLAKQLKDKL